MLKDSIDLPNENLDFSISKGKTVDSIINFLDVKLPGFTSDLNTTAKNEDDISQECCIYLDREARESLFMFHFQHKYEGGRSSDFSVISAKKFSSKEPLFVIEAKRLPTPGTGRQQEYVHGNLGGIERFKREYHGSGLSRSAMFGYIQKETCDHWLGEINSWSSPNAKVKSFDFYGLIELYTFFQLQDLGVSPNAILTVRQAICDETGVRYPFATFEMLSDGQKIWQRFQDAITNADRSLQTNFIGAIEQFARKIDFGKNHEACLFFPRGRNSDVVVSPHHQFGQPVIEGTNIIAETLYLMYLSGESIEFISHLYDLDPKSVNDAISFYKIAA